MTELDAIGTLFGTDKSSAHSMSWDYLRHYEKLFAEWKNDEINLIEIGVFGGASLHLWRWFFAKATIIGIDINPDCLRFAGDRIKIKIGSQEDPSFLQTVASAHPPTIVIDDGSHIAHHMITSFETLFPQLRPGGLYIFEDMSFHFEDGAGQWQGFKAHQGLSDTPMYEYLSRFTRARAANVNVPKAAWGFSRYAYEHIDSVLVFGGVIVVRKRAPRDFAGDVEVFEREMQREVDVDKKARFVQYLVKHDVYHDRAVSLLRELLKSKPHNVKYLTDLYQVLTRLARVDEAAEAVAEITRHEPSNRWAWQTLADLQRKRQRTDLELLALEGLAKLTEDPSALYARMSILHENSGNIKAALAAANKARNINPKNPEFSRRVTALETRLPRDPA